MTTSTQLTAFILAFDQGSSMPFSKYMYPIAGVPIILRVVKALKGLSCQQEAPIDLDICVVTKKETYPKIKELLSSYTISYIQQDHLKVAMDNIRSHLTTNCDSSAILFVSADSFFTQINDLISIVKSFQKFSSDLTIAAYNYKSDLLKRQTEKSIYDERSKSNIYILKKTVINDLLSLSYSYQGDSLIRSLTDMFLKFSQKNREKTSHTLLNEDTFHSVHSQKELAAATKRVFQRKCQRLMEKGVVIIDPENTYIEDDVDIKATTMIYPNTYILGNSQIAEGCEVEPNSIIRDSQIGSHVKVKASSYLESVIIDSHSLIGPYARLRPETHVGKHCKIGNFVEAKKTVFADHVKASHLTYLGDAEIGSHVNIGCGTITCNYREDHKKYKTLIEDDVFVGSDVQFIAPVKVGKGSVIGSGSTITDEVPPNSLAIARAKQVTKKDRMMNNKTKKIRDS